MFSSLLVPHPAAAFPQPLFDTGHVWLVTPGHARTFIGSAFGDGSGLNPRSHLTRRCGWSVVGTVSISPHVAVCHHENVGAQVMLYGALPGLLQEVPLAELFAFIMAIAYSVPDGQGKFTFHTDCKWVLDSYNAGWTSCTASSHMEAALWRWLFRLVDRETLC